MTSSAVASSREALVDKLLFDIFVLFMLPYKPVDKRLFAWFVIVGESQSTFELAPLLLLLLHRPTELSTEFSKLFELFFEWLLLVIGALLIWEFDSLLLTLEPYVGVCCWCDDRGWLCGLSVQLVFWCCWQACVI